MWAGWNLDRMIWSKRWKSFPDQLEPTWSPQEGRYTQEQDSWLCSRDLPKMCNPEQKYVIIWLEGDSQWRVLWKAPGRTELDKVWKGHAGRSRHPNTAKPAQGELASSWKYDLNNGCCSSCSYFWPVAICWREGGDVRRSRVSLSHPKYLCWSSYTSMRQKANTIW